MRRRIQISREQAIGLIVIALMVVFFELVIQLSPRPAQEPLALTAQDTAVALTLQAHDKYSFRASEDSVTLCLQPFDPNTADSLTLRRLGLSAYQVRSVLRYRAKGGVYRTTKDWRRMYFMTDSLYDALCDYLLLDSVAPTRFDSLAGDSLPRYASLKRDTVLCLNLADTAELKMIRGVGAYLAERIVNYRAQLGGYTNKEQLRELTDVRYSERYPLDSVLCHLTICDTTLRQLPVNRCSVAQLTRHPYLNYSEAEAIYNLRRSRIRIDDLETLRRAAVLSEEKLNRLAPYLSFE